MTAQPNQSLQHGLVVLEALAGAARPLGSRELARRLGMEHTRVNRLLGTLADIGMVVRTPERAYAAGPGVHVLAALALRGSGLVQAALPVIRDHLADLPWIALGVRWRDQVCYLLHGDPAGPVETMLAGHDLWPADRSSIGLLLRAEAGEGAEADRIRARGWAWCTPPDRPGSLAVPVGSPAVAGLAVVPKRELDDGALAGLAARMQGAAARIASALPEAPRRAGVRSDVP